MACEHPEHCDVAAEILSTTPEQIARLPNVGLAESALAALCVGFGVGVGFGDMEVPRSALEGRHQGGWPLMRAPRGSAQETQQHPVEHEESNDGRHHPADLV